ncbi:ATP-binding protein [Pseudonocardia hydrocarbonoxydans]|uniref:SARP family transcriptional regulator n=1 Tax=Pseudonocardia hydrocarbonoxydans TaxID=76726 RepID=A0A4Y3WWL7_9PSEU|nr:AAA family ATPase [Pseudonocardia hydrocarbonoxydans]GEC21756.1 SARP family transcriptional regulator [Pseudonocardia hydrocarbonoxydans]
MDIVMVRLCGVLEVTRGDEPVVVVGRKARLLLARLAAADGAVLAAADLVEALWADTLPARPANDVATLVSRLRAALGPAAVLGGRDGYRLGPDVRTDIADAVSLSREGTRQLRAGRAALAAAAARRGVELLGDGRALVGSPEAGWVLDLRGEVTALLRTLRHLLAEAATAADDPAVAITAGRAAVMVDPLDECAHRLLMAAHDAAGEQDRALAVYERLRSALAEELGVDPDEHTRALHVAILHGRTPAPARRTVAAAPPRAPAGRDAELAVLATAWEAAVVGDARTVLVTGEAGIGKTTLAEAAAAFAVGTGGLVLRARCYAAERSLFLRPVLDALGPALLSRPAPQARRLAGPAAGVLAGMLSDAAGVLGEPEPPLGSPEMARSRALDAVRDAVHGLAATAPVLLLLDDLHNAGVATVELLHHLARRSAGTRLLALATVRTEEGAAALDALAEVTDRVEVGPLGPDAVALLAARAGAARRGEDVLRRTRGHTLFVVECLRALAAGEHGVPESLQAAILARLRRAGSDIERMLRAGAVLGTAVSPDLVAAMLELPAPTVVHLCEEAAAARLLVAVGAEYEFANDLLHEALYATTPTPTRLAHHHRAADLLADRPEALAGHAEALGDRPRAARAWLAAGEDALARFASADARALLDRAVAAVPADDPVLTGRIHLARSRACESLADFEPALHDVRAGVDHFRAAGERRLEMTALRRYLSDLAPVVPAQELEQQLATGVRIAHEFDDKAAQADLLGGQAILAANRLRFAEAIELGRRAVAAGRAGRNEEALAGGLDGLKTAYAYLGETERLAPVLAELEPLLRRQGRLHLLHWAVFESALPAVAAADWDTAIARIDDALAINRRSGPRAPEVWIVAHRGWVERLRGRYAEAVELGRQATRLARAAPHDWWLPTAHALLASTLLELGEVAEATVLLREAETAARRGGTEAYLLRSLAPLAQATGSPEVLEAADALLGRIRAPAGSAWLAGGDTYLTVARAWRQRGEPRRARVVLAPLLTAARRTGWIPWLTAGELEDAAALAELGEHVEAKRLRHRAGELARRHGMPHLAERAAAAVSGARRHSSSASRAAARAAPPGSTGA